MLKLIGAMLVLIAGTAFGFQQAARYADRAVQLRQLLQVLQRLETEIGYGHTPLADALERSAAGRDGPVAALLTAAAGRLRAGGPAFRDCWRETIESGWRDTALRDPERAAVLGLGDALGISDRMDQIKHIRLAAAALQAEEATARDEQVRYGKMWRSLGFMAAALVVILMV